MRIISRAGKAFTFLRSSLVSPAVHPWPWTESDLPYHIMYPLDNRDGHGGYASVYRFDRNGVPLLKHERARPYHPLVVARYALKLLRISEKMGNRAAARQATRLVSLLVRSGEKTGSWGPGASAETMSALPAYGNIQGVLISVLLRFARRSPRPEIADLIEHAFQRLVSPVSAGGCLSSLDGGPFLEEFPRTPPSHQLGGCTSGLFGLYDMADGLDHKPAARCASQIEETIIRNIGRFVTRNGWSYYALNVYGHRYLASMHYHLQHLARMRVIEKRTRAVALSRVIRAWQTALDSTSVRLQVGFAKSAQVVWLRNVRRLPLHES